VHPATYLAAWIPGLLTLVGIGWGGAWAWATPIAVFVVVPVLDQWVPRTVPAMPPPRGVWAVRATRLIQGGSGVLLFVALAALLWMSRSSADPWRDLPAWLGNLVSVGILCGVYGLNVGHEIGHRRAPLARGTAVAMMMTSLYGHFWVEHNLGHHVRVATPDDPASAQRGESVFAFWPRSIVGSARSAFALRPHLVSALWVAQALLLMAVWATLGASAALAWIGAATVGILLLETVNYVEHYGLQRQRLADGRYERVAPHHSWNAEHLPCRALLFDLPRHSDHHAHPARMCTSLRNFETAPQLPFGYAAMILIAMVPALFRRVVHPELDRLQDLGQRRQQAS
jgi:alkane 1-monooxygenase